MDLTIVISTASILISIVNLLMFYKIENKKVGKEDVHKSTNFLLELDKILIADPQLWSIYDSHYVCATVDSNDLLFRAKKDALLYYIINFHEIIYENYENNKKSPYWMSWNRIFKELLSDSLQLKEMVRTIIGHHPVNPRPYIIYLSGLLEVVEHIDNQ